MCIHVDMYICMFDSFISWYLIPSTKRYHSRSDTEMRRSARPQLAPPPPRRRLRRLQATPVVRCVESSCTLPAALPCAVGVQEPLSRLFVAGTTTSSLTGARARLQAQGRLHPSYTHTNTNTFGPCAFGPCAFDPRAFKHQHLRPLRLWPLRLGPSCSPGARLRWRTGMTSQCTKPTLPAFLVK